MKQIGHPWCVLVHIINLRQLLSLLAVPFVIMGCNLDGQITSLNSASLLNNIIIDDNTTPSYANHSNQNAIPIFGTCPIGASQIYIESPINKTLACVDGTFSDLLDFSSLADGQYQVRLTPNVGESHIWSLTKDTNFPSVNIVHADDYITSDNVTSYSISGTCSENGQFVYVSVGIANIPTICSAGSFTGEFDFASVPEGAVTLLARQNDAAGNSTTSTATRLKDTIPPGITSLGDAPPTPSPQVHLNITVSGTDAIRYGYKIGATSSINCHDGAGYSTFTSTSTHIIEDLSDVIDTTMRLCVWTEDLVGNKQLLTDVLQYDWEKDSTIALATVSGFTPSGSPSNSGVTRTVSIDGLNISHYKAVVVFSQNCSTANFSSAAEMSVSTDFNVPIVADGDYRVCVIGKNIANNWQADHAATSSSILTIDRSQPTLLLSSGSPDPFGSSNFTVTATFSESVTGFSIGDINVTNGTASSLSGSGTTYTFTVTPSTQGLVTVAVGSGVADDSAGNSNMAATNLTRTYDSVSPTLVLSSTAPDPFNSASLSVTATFSEVVTGFTLSDINVTNGTASALSGSGATYTFTVTPTTQGLVTVAVGTGVANDSAGNGNTAATNLTKTYDSVQPTLVLSSAASDPFNSASIAVTATFSEIVTGFTLADINVTNGTASAFSGSGTTYTFTVTPTTQGLVTVDVGAGVANDSAGNDNTAATNLTKTYDSVQPTLVLSSAASDPFNSPNMTVTAIFTESVTGFSIGDINVTNGTASSLSGSGTTYTFTVTPSAQGLVTVAVDSGVATDIAGNNNAVASNLTRIYDSVSPTLVLSSTAPDPFNSASITVTATFLEAVTGFTLGDINVTNGTASAFSGSGTTYTFTVTPTTQGLITVGIGAGAAIDAANNSNTAATDLTRAYDSIGPTITGLSNDSTWKTTKTWNWGCSETCTYRFVVDTSTGTIPSGVYGSTTTISQSSGSGTHYLHIQAQDLAGNTSTMHVSALLDNTNPTSPTSLNDGTTLNSLNQSPTITFTGGSDSHSGVLKHQLRVLRSSDSFVMKDWHDFASGNLVTGLTLSTDTSYKVEVKTIDNLSFESTATSSDGWIADITAPGTASGLSLGSVPNNLTTSPILNWSAASDGSGSGVASYEARIFRTSDNATMSPWTSLASGGSITGMTLVGGTQYYFRVRAKDNAGNVGSESPISSSWTAVSCMPGSQTFTYTGADQTFTVPTGCSSITVKMWGAGGGGGNFSGYSPQAGGGGGYTTGVLSVTPNESLTVIVGQGGRGSFTTAVGATYGGGGAMGPADWDGESGGQGGGRSAIRRSSSELLTAGGGGGAGHHGGGGAGGGLSGLNAVSYYAAGGASQAAGGAAGTGGMVNGNAGSQFTGANGKNYSGDYNASSGSGGGGYYGGGSGAVTEEPWSCEVGGGGGGSGFLGSATSASTTAGSGATPGNSGDSDRSGAGQGGTDYNISGTHGVVKISW